MMDNAARMYREEAAELIAGLEVDLLELERTPEDLERVDAVFRALHTIKGSGAMFGFDAIADFTHRLESAFDMVRSRQMKVSAELISLTLAARDHIKGLLEETDPQGGPAILVQLQALMEKAPADELSLETPAKRETLAPVQAEQTFRVRFTPCRETFLNGTNPLLLLRELSELGTCDVRVLKDELPKLRDLDPELCYTGWEILLRTSRGENAVRDVFLFVDDDRQVQIEPMNHGTETTLAALAAATQNKAESPVAAAIDTPPPEVAANPGARQEKSAAASADAVSSIRVAADKLDSLVNIVGELVTVQARLMQMATASGNSEILFVAEEVERLTGKLRDNTMSIRMVPIGTTFSRFQRVVRDLSRELGKDVRLVTEGGDTELDKTVIERLTDPLVHLIRNSMDHGIEAPEIRAAQGKPGKGTIRLSAAHSGTNVVITISDDGAGLNAEAIRRRAIERGLLTEDASVPDEQLFSLICEPGFSTAKEVTEVSGRGVGMDVVRRNIQALRGTLAIASSAGQGTLITLRLPLTLAIIDGLLVRVAGDSYVIPVSAVVECLELIHDGNGQRSNNVIQLRNEPIGCVRLRDIYGITDASPRREHVVIAQTAHGKYGFVVDVVVGDHQTVIKPLSALYKDVETISGATILGDGTVAAIIDVDKMAALALAEQRAAR